ncbi:MAG: hypothetical protein U0L88_12035, partial [Acutalibacteraceae bacterium]|nr:hypothetical protein [Acutalibacteraceae bacterium]
DYELVVSTSSAPNLQTGNTVAMNIAGMGFENDEPYISCIIKNKSDQLAINYGPAFYIYDGENEVKPNGSIAWDDGLWVLKNGQENSQTFNLKDYDLEENKTYRLVKNYNIEGYNDTYSMYVDFKIDKSEITGQILTKKNDIWLHNESTISVEEIPTYMLGDDNVLYSKVFNDANVIKHWYKTYELEEFKPTKDDFKGISEGKWSSQSYTLDKLLAENETALRYIIDENGNFIYILKQNNGEIYYVKGWSGVDGLYQISLLESNTN